MYLLCTSDTTREKTLCDIVTLFILFRSIIWYMSALIERAKANSEAYESLYIKLYTPIYRFLYFRLLNKEVAEDLTHDVFVQIYSSETVFESEDHERRYFFTAARNRLIDYLRKKKDVPLDEEFVANVPDTTRSDDVAVSRESQLLVRKLLAQLSEDQYTALTLKYIEDKDTEEIALIMDKSLEAVRQLQSRGMHTLREKSKDYE